MVPRESEGTGSASNHFFVCLEGDNPKILPKMPPIGKMPSTIERNVEAQLAKRKSKFTDCSKLSSEASLIQNAWIKSTMESTIREFISTNVMKIAREGDFDKMKEKMMERGTIMASIKLLCQIIKSDPVAMALTKPQRSARILLSAFLISNFRDELMPQPNNLELEMIQHAEQFVSSLGALLCDSGVKVVHETANKWTLFKDSFLEWQAEDRSVLTQSLINDYGILSDIQKKLAPEAADEWMPHIERHKGKLLKTIQRVGGPSAIEYIKEIDGEVNVDNVETAKEDVTSSEVKHEIDSEMKPFLENIQIAHELMVDPSFNFSKLYEMRNGKSFNPRPNLHFQINDMALFVQFVLEIKRQLIEMASNSTISGDLKEHLDEELLTKQVETSSVDGYEILDFLGQCMAKMCAPIRDSMASKIIMDSQGGQASLQDICVEIAELMSLMNSDMADYGLQKLKLRISNFIVVYEREWFAKNVLSKGDLKNVTLLLRKIMESNQLKEDNVGLVIRESLLIAVNLSGLIEDYDIDKNELLVLDSHRLPHLRDNFKQTIIGSGIDIILRNAKIPNIDELILECEDDPDKLCSRIRNLTLPKETIDILCNSMKAVTQMKDPLSNVLRRRVVALLDNKEHKSLSILRKHGIAAKYCERFTLAVEEFRRMEELHYKVLSPVYQKLIKDVRNE